MSECTHNCETCSANCGERESQSLIEKTNELSNVKKVIGVVSGKGGVGKSLVTSMLATLSQRNGYKTAVLDADITGPSIPRMFGLGDKRAEGNNLGILPVKTKTGIETISLNFMVENENDPVIWRGPVIAGAVKQFWTDVIWNDVDFMFVDMPPGTGDVALTVFQSIPVDGIVIVASPQDLVSMIVEKAVKMAKVMNIPIIGIVENMSYIQCPDCNKKIKIFGESHIDKVAEDNGTKVIARIPIDPKFSAACDSGLIELFEDDCLNDAFAQIEKLAK